MACSNVLAEPTRTRSPATPHRARPQPATNRGAARDRTRKETVMDMFIGQIELFPFNFSPTDWSPCDGKLLSIAEHTALFSLLGTNFGGDGQSTFALPDLRGKEPAPGMAYYIAL